ncbi:hypothetical protein SAY87_005962 [Trapa incisa]|uniref:TRF2/HOY1 PH-like domain-containing protein n=1 Tax=Trapa incisa TaxID=236973 RepID=A0AAN7K9T6_9MYRT|nr:hypothetical protein SAY87_005962 [Trapa incisa]
MVHRMDSCQKVKVKMEGDERAAHDLLERADKRPRLSGDGDGAGTLQSYLGSIGAEFNPLNEPSPLGLRLKKSPSLLELIQMRLSQEQSPTSLSLGAKSHRVNSADKLKASNFPASLLKIGTWEYKSKYEGDLVAKCYFAKHKLVWEVLDGALKNKIEIQWSDIVAIKANYAVEGTDTLEVVLARQPLFFRETNPQPRKHTLWQPTSDFTSGQASIHRHHLLHCPQALLGRHFEKLIQCDPRLNFLSQQPEIVLECPYFEPKGLVFHESNEPNHQFGLRGEEMPTFYANSMAASRSGTQSSSSKNESQELLSTGHDNYSTSPSSVMDGCAIEEIGSSSLPKEPSILGPWGQVKVPGSQPSMSLSDLITHISNCITEQNGINGKQQMDRDVLEELTRHLLSDSNMLASSSSDEQSLMSRVNSLCCLLQDPVSNSGTHVPSTVGVSTVVQKTEIEADLPMLLPEFNGGPPRAMLRKDSLGDLLLNLPRIASLPHILPIVPEDSLRGKR